MAKTLAQKRRREAEASQENQANGDTTTAAADGASRPSKKARVEEGRSLFVRNLPPTATSETLVDLFSQHYPVKHAHVVLDPQTAKSRGYGFVTFTDADDALEAQKTLDNHLLEKRRIKLDKAESRARATTKDGVKAVPTRVAEEKKIRDEQLAEARKAPKLIVRNLPWSVKTKEDLTNLFRMHGKVKFADLPSSKGKLSGFGFVTMRGKKNAETAMQAINGKMVDGRTLAVDWAVDKATWEKQQAEEQPDADDAEPTKKSKKEGKIKKDGKAAPESEKSKKPTDEDMEADEDLKNFLKNHMENLEEEDDSGNEDQTKSDDEEDDWEDGDSEAEEKSEAEDAAPPKKALSTDNSTTIFIRNLPFTSTDETLKDHFTKFGPIRYARIVMDRATDRPAGTGFVCFVKAEDFTACLRGAPKKKIVAATRTSVLQDETIDQDGRYTIEGRVLQVTPAVSKDEATRLTAEGPAASRGENKDKRRLFLLSEGTISKNSPLYTSLPQSEVLAREASAKQRKKLIESNPSLHLSLTRLAIRNIPRGMDSKELKALAREAVVGFATDVKEGRREALSKEEIARSREQDKEAEHNRKLKKKGVVKQAKIVFETQEGSKVAEGSGAGKSRGYGFVEYTSHRCALMGLRWLNGHALKGEGGKTLRLIVEFAIENVNVVMRRRTNEENARGRVPVRKEEGAKSDGRNGEGGPPRNKWGRGAAKDGRLGGKIKGSKSQHGVEKAPEDRPLDKKENKAAKADKKLAMRQQIIGRKRMMRKKKAEFRKGK